MRRPPILAAGLLLATLGCTTASPSVSDAPGQAQTLPIVIDQPAECRGPVEIDPETMAKLLGNGEERMAYELYGIPVLAPRERVAFPERYSEARAAFAEAETRYAGREYAAAGAGFASAAEQFSVDDDSPWAGELESIIEYTCKNAVLSMLMGDDRDSAQALAESASDEACRRGAKEQLEALAD